MTRAAEERRCDACGTTLDQRCRFCPGCGKPTARASGLTCPACGSPHPDAAAFCSQCGAHLGSIAEAERRVITVLFADLSGFTRLTERLDPETVHGLVASCLEPLTDCVTRWGGYVDKFIGDCVMALFGAPAAYENEPERALRAALDMRDVLRDWVAESRLGPDLPDDVKPRLGIGVNTGPVVTGLFSGGGARDYTAVGDVVNVASRLQSLCDPGEVLVGERTWREAEHIFEFGDERVVAVRGREEPVRARPLLALRSERRSARGFEGRSAPLVDREEELERLREAWFEVEGGAGRTLLVLGAPGIGKSRLVQELISVEDVEPSRAARGRSYPYARRTPWEPISELLCEMYGLPGRLDPSRAAAELARKSALDWTAGQRAALSVALGRSATEVDALAGQSPADRHEAVSNAVARALDGSGSEPSLLVLEDLQWADQTTLEFLRDLQADEPFEAVLLVLVARPALPEETGLAKLLGSQVDRLELQPLSPDESREMLDGILGEHDLPEGFVATIVERAEGNPLFLEEMVKSLADEGHIRKEEGGWSATGDPEELDLPGGVESLLSTRMDMLSSSTKRVLQYASVVGRRFWSGVLAEALAGRPVEEDLDRLREGALVRPLPDSRVPGDREYAFEHLLLQEVAYDSLLRGMRQDLHGAVAGWLEQRAGEEDAEYDDLIAHHWERSDEPRRAVPALERTARRAREEGAPEDARSAVERALELVEDPDRRGYLLGLAEDLAADLADRERRSELIEQLDRLADEDGKEAFAAEAAYRRARLALEEGRLEEAGREGRSALEVFRRTGEVSREGDSLSLLGRVAHLWGDYEEARRRYEASLPLQREAGDRYGEAEILDRTGLVQLDLGRMEEALDTFEEARSLFVDIGAPAMEARCTAHRATALRFLGLLPEAEEAGREAVQLARSSGSPRARASAEYTLATVLGDLGERERATELLTRVTEFAEGHGRRGLAARCHLARSEVLDGREAIAWAGRAREAAVESGLVHVEILALAREAEVRLDGGEVERAEELSDRARRLLMEHGNIQGPEERVHWVRARALRAADRPEEAREAAEAARETVLQKAEWIEDRESRTRFLEGRPVNTAILARGRSA